MVRYPAPSVSWTRRLRNHVLETAVYALAIASVIATMAAVPNPRLKAIIYALPIPITLVLISTGGAVNSSHVIGLLLITLFLWIVHFGYRLGLPILAADLLGTVVYVGAGWLLVTFTRPPFALAVALYACVWLGFCLVCRRGHAGAAAEPSRVHPALKFAGVSLLAFGLLSVKNLLGGIIVTFPFSGVFAVVEGRSILGTMALKFTQNSIAILFLFVTVHLTGALALGWRLTAGWAVYLAAFAVLSLIFDRQALRAWRGRLR